MTRNTALLFVFILFVAIMLHVFEEDSLAIIFTIWASTFCIYAKIEDILNFK